MSLLNPEIILPEAVFQTAHGKKKGWISESWTLEGEKPSQYSHDHLQAQLDWNGNPEELDREEDALDKIDHEVLYSEELDDYPDDIPDLEDSESMNTSVYDWLGATPASTTVSTDTEAAGDMLNLSMGLLELLASHKASDPVDKTDSALSDDDQLQDMFKILAEVPVHRDPTPTKPWLDPWALMAEAQFKSGWRLLPPPPELRRPKSDPDTWNVVLRSI